jgi:CheY-like chemotaxis protein
MFSRGDRSNTRSQAGLGIGLALARRLAEMHGGTLDARSAGPGAGSEFRVRLPISAHAPRKGEVESRDQHQVSQAQRILVVDDNHDAAETLGALLGFLGADVRLASDGPKALGVFAEYDPTLVFLDIGMPGMDGYEVANRIRKSFPERHPVLVALTGWGQAEDRRRAREAGFDHHLVKPAELAALQTLLALHAPD